MCSVRLQESVQAFFLSVVVKVHSLDSCAGKCLLVLLAYGVKLEVNLVIFKINKLLKFNLRNKKDSLFIKMHKIYL